MKLEDLDKNFLQDGGDEDLIYVEAQNLPVKITGFPWLKENGNFHRLPDKYESKYNEKLNKVRRSSSGGAIRFKTNTHLLGIQWELDPDSLDASTRQASNGAKGFDIYFRDGENMTFEGCINAKSDDGIHYRGAKHFSHEQIMKEIVLNFPLYSEVTSIKIGIDPNAVIEMPEPLKYEKPVVFYGSSITQGGCASRPGLNYTALLARKLGFDQINLGFSGSAKGEDFIAEMIADLPMTAFVYDYDNNAPSVEHLEQTHEKFFRIIRQANPTLPIVMISRTNTYKRPKFPQYREVILKTYQNALAAGDKHVYFIDGEKLFGEEDRLECTVDNVHPNDLGFYRMYRGILPILKEALENAE